MSDEEIVKALSLVGEVKVFSHRYKAYNAGVGKPRKNIEERLFVCHVK